MAPPAGSDVMLHKVYIKCSIKKHLLIMSDFNIKFVKKTDQYLKYHHSKNFIVEECYVDFVNEKLF